MNRENVNKKATVKTKHKEEENNKKRQNKELSFQVNKGRRREYENLSNIGLHVGVIYYVATSVHNLLDYVFFCFLVGKFFS